MLVKSVSNQKSLHMVTSCLQARNVAGVTIVEDEPIESPVVSDDDGEDDETGSVLVSDDDGEDDEDEEESCSVVVSEDFEGEDVDANEGDLDSDASLDEHQAPGRARRAEGVRADVAGLQVCHGSMLELLHLPHILNLPCAPMSA